MGIMNFSAHINRSLRKDALSPINRHRTGQTGQLQHWKECQGVYHREARNRGL